MQTVATVCFREVYRKRFRRSEVILHCLAEEEAHSPPRIDMNEDLRKAAEPKRGNVLLALALILVGLPAWTMLYMFVIRPPLFQFIMGLFGVDSMSVPVALHVVIVLGVPFGLLMLWDRAFGQRGKVRP